MNQSTSNEINIVFIYESLDTDSIKCNLNEKIINIFKEYCKKKGIDLNSHYFICNGDQIKDYEKTFDQLANRENKINMEIKILVFKAYTDDESNYEASKLNVFFMHPDPNYTRKITVNENERIENICNKYENESNFKPNSIIYKYEGIELDLDKTFGYYNKSKNDIIIRVYPKTLVLIIFAYLGNLYNIECYKEDKIEDICSDFTS